MAASSSRNSAVIILSHTPSPLGNLHIATCDGAVCYLGFEKKGYREDLYSYLGRYLKLFEVNVEKGEHAGIQLQLDRYFDGKLKKFRMKTHLFGTEFQLQVC